MENYSLDNFVCCEEQFSQNKGIKGGKFFLFSETHSLKLFIRFERKSIMRGYVYTHHVEYAKEMIHNK